MDKFLFEASSGVLVFVNLNHFVCCSAKVELGRRDAGIGRITAAKYLFISFCECYFGGQKEFKR